MRRPSNWPIIGGMAWSFSFALISFYWASGGMLGAATLGGRIYEMALVREPDFIRIVWLTGFMKAAGGLLLAMTLKVWDVNVLNKMLYASSLAIGILLFVYGLLNFTTILLSVMNVWDLQIDSYAAWWRLLGWEPYWMLGGILYVLSGRRFAGRRKEGRPETAA